MYKICNQNTFYESKTLIGSDFKNIQIIKSGQNYSTYEYCGVISYEVTCLDDELLKNNGVWTTSANHCFEFQKVNLQYTQKDEGKLNISTKSPFFYNLEYEVPKDYKMDLNESKVVEKVKFCGEKGKIVYLAIHVDYRTYCEYTYQSLYS